MDNNYFLFSNSSITIKRFHLCTWEMRNETALVEFGVEICPPKTLPDELNISLYVPWLEKTSKVYDLYDNLKDPSNCRFIFNDTIINSIPNNKGKKDLGTIQVLKDHGELYIIPIKSKIEDKLIQIVIETEHLKTSDKKERNFYFRFYLEPNISLITTRDNGIAKTTLIYEIKVNEQRNLPEDLYDKTLCKIESCFVLHIIPNNYEIVFLNNKICKGIRTLEFDSFKKYLGNKPFEQDELIVIFNKKSDTDSYIFFSSYAKERISMTQILIAIFINLLCSLLFFLSTLRTHLQFSYLSINFWKNTPWEVYFCIVCMIIFIFYISFHEKIRKIRQIFRK